MSDTNSEPHVFICDDTIFSRLSIECKKRINEHTRRQLLEEYSFLNENMTLDEMFNLVEDYYKKHPDEYNTIMAKAEVESDLLFEELLALAEKMDDQS